MQRERSQVQREQESALKADDLNQRVESSLKQDSALEKTAPLDKGAP